MKDGFIWGTATASYQIEGAWNEDGKTPSIWDVFTHEGKAFRGQTGDVACDHYHRYAEDVALMAELGLTSYRFSVSWPRILPDESGVVNEAGVAFYNNLIDELLAHGIQPLLTLYHWDMPEYVFKNGGFMNRDYIIEQFSAYTRVIAQRFGDRVKVFMPINEPACVLGALINGNHAPGTHCTMAELNKATHNLLLCHGAATRILHELVPGCKVGFGLCGWVPVPIRETEECIAAARKKYYELGEEHLIDIASGMTDAVVYGKYSEEFLECYRDTLPEIREGDMELMCAPLDFIGANIYSGYYVNEAGEVVPFEDGNAQSFMNWDDIPESLYWALKFLAERYPHLPIMVTENGWAGHDRVSLDGKVHDPNRIDMMTKYLRGVQRAMDEGVQVDGYYYWTFMDNFEWAEGYRPRFGIVHVDFETLKRTKKDSFEFYKQVIKTNGKALW